MSRKKLVDPYIVAIDSTLLRAKGHLWHKSSMIEGIVPCSGVDNIQMMQDGDSVIVRDGYLAINSI
ncbi:MAG TPA: hypothetical protein VFJ05_00810 [Nitrososphaeraceae archaeon]|nr:hypothetical protein [Nitrososphaeraceae archaeon]